MKDIFKILYESQEGRRVEDFDIPDYKELLEKEDELYEKVYNKQLVENKSLFEEFVNAIDIRTREEQIYYFAKGFKTALMLAFEAYAFKEKED